MLPFLTFKGKKERTGRWTSSFTSNRQADHKCYRSHLLVTWLLVFMEMVVVQQSLLQSWKFCPQDMQNDRIPDLSSSKGIKLRNLAPRWEKRGGWKLRLVSAKGEMKGKGYMGYLHWLVKAFLATFPSHFSLFCYHLLHILPGRMKT